MKEATDIQLQVLEFCKEEEKRNGRFPTHLAIMAQFGWASTMAVRSHLTALEKKGLIEKIGRYYRIKVVIDWREELEKVVTELKRVIMMPDELLSKRMNDAIKLLEENPA